MHGLIVIGLTGKAGAGKSTVAAFLAKHHGFQRIRFSDTLKNMLRAAGLTEDHIEGSLKETPCEVLCGKTPRQVMQTLGTEWGRNLVGEDLWINLWADRVAKHQFVVVEDVRFENEAATIRNMGGVIVQIDCPWAGTASGEGHSSEAGVKADYVVHNSDRGNVDTLYAHILNVLSTKSSRI